MSVFGSGSGTSQDVGGRGTRDAALTIISHGTRLVGELESAGVVKIDGVLDGTVRAEREVLVAKGGIVQGDIHTAEAVIGGEVIGSIFADGRVEVQEGATVRGDIVTRKLLVHEGGDVNGTIHMGDPRDPQTVPDLPEEHMESSPRPYA